jgi:cytochrome oxidase Cu insertion factor (SCO1/SenC/PrrC family)
VLPRFARVPHAPACALTPYNGGMTLRPGDFAPDFTLPDAAGETVTLSALRGRPVVIVFLRWLG